MKLSICIPVYKVESYIEKCARSLFEQTYEDLEFIFIDDCSPDGSFAVLEKVLADYPKRRGQVKIVRHEKNAGLIRARKTGLAAATGELVTHCDSDDWIDRDFYAKMVEKFADPEVDMVFAPMVRNDDEPLKGMWDVEYSGTGLEYLDMAGRIVAFNSTVNKVYRREIACADDVEVPDCVKMAEDMCRTCQSVIKCRRVTSITGAYYHYRVNLQSMSQKFDARGAIDDLELVYETIDARVPKDVGLVVRKLALRDVLFHALRFGVMPREEFDVWAAKFKAIPSPWPADTSRKRRVMLELAFRSYGLVRFAFSCLKWWKFKGF